MKPQFPTRSPRITVVGSGPSGCFLAGAVRKALPQSEITVIDRLPCPFGLVRYGVAADHQSTKAITRQFDRLFTREGITFLGNVRVGDGTGPGTVTLDELRRRSDAVVLATGLSADRPLGIPGSDRPGVFGAGALTRILNSHPDETVRQDVLGELGARLGIIGLGNVSLDIVRLLTKHPDDFDGSDINDDALAHYHRQPATELRVFSRSPLTAAKCDAAMIRELAQIPGLRVELHGDTATASAAGDDARSPEHRTQVARAESIQSLAEATSQVVSPRVLLHLHFSTRPVAILGDDEESEGRARGIVVESPGDPAPMEWTVDSVISAIGFDADTHTPPEALSNSDDQDPANVSTGRPGRIAPGLYRVGWLRRGPRGTIPENRSDALSVAREIVADLENGAIPLGTLPEKCLPPEAAAAAVTYEQWQRIDQHEVGSADARRARTKIQSLEHMLAIASSQP